MAMFINKTVNLPELQVTNENGFRYYQTPTGEKYPSVTTMLSHFKKDVIIEWRKKVGHEEANKVMKAASTRGTHVHNLVEKFINGEHISIKDTNTFYYSLYLPIRDLLYKNLSEIWAVEAPLYSDKLKLAGRTDLIGVYDGEPSIIDFKTSTKEKRKEWITDYFIQASIYAIMFKERTGIVINNYVIIIVDEEGGVTEFTGKCTEHFNSILKMRKLFPH